MTAKRLFIIDAMAMAFRNFHAFGARPISNSKGLPTSAIFGSAQFLIKLLAEEKPDYIVIATDSIEPTFRHELYDKYKANRSEMPEDLAVQLPHLFRLFAALNIELLKKPGVEADDLIASLVTLNRGDNLQCFIVSGDKDFMQLIDANTYLFVPQKGGAFKTISETGVFEKFGCKPNQVVDVLALMGDSSDNVPGVRGVGEKGASKLISEFGSLDALYASLDSVKNEKLKKALRDQKDMAFLCKKLVSLHCDIENLPTLDTFKVNQLKSLGNFELLKFMQEMEFRRLSEQVSLWMTEHDDSLKPQQTGTAIESATPDKTYKLVVSQKDFEDMLQVFSKVDRFALDTETTGLDVIEDQPIGFSLCSEAGSAYYVPLVSQHGQVMPREEILEQIAPLLRDPKKTKIAHNLKFDLQMFANIGIEVERPFIDTMIASYLLSPASRSHGLDGCCLEHLNFKKIPTAALIGKDAKTAISMLDVPIELLNEYACEDADYTLRLSDHFLPKIEAEGLNKVFYEVEMPLVPVLAHMEQRGVFVDSETLSVISGRLTELASNYKTSIYREAGETFNINSTKQLQTIIFEKLKIHEQLNITRLKKTKSGYSTDVSVLERMSDHPLPRALLAYRTVTKLKNTYVDVLPLLIHPKTGRIHTKFHQTGTATGRLSSSDPNLQNIPNRSEMGREIRKAFRAQYSDHLILSADYSQIELRILAHLSGDENLIAAFQRGDDIHSSTASKIFGIPIGEVDRKMRDQAKAINFGIIYGMGASRLARETGVTYKQAEDFINRYFDGYPKIGKFIQQTIEGARSQGFTRTITGRKRSFLGEENGSGGRPFNIDNIAINTPIQGSAADLIKIAMIRLEEEFRKHKLAARMLLQVHDELVFEVAEKEIEQTSKIVREIMEGVISLEVPLLVNISHGKNWLEAH